MKYIKILKMSQILIYYDIPELFLAKDSDERNYLCLLVYIDNQLTKYITIEISLQRLTSLVNGTTDLRDVFINPEIPEWLSFNGIGESIEAEIMQIKTIPDAFLPESGFIFKEIELNNII